jgi:tetratricopeptide (TPR) repeat protein
LGSSRKKRARSEEAVENSSARKLYLSRKDALLAVVVVVLVLIAFLPAFRAGWIWDDDEYVTRNHLLTAKDGLYRIWLTTDSPSQYFPLVYTTFRIEHSVWGLDARGYHAVNIVLHATNALLIWLLLAQLGVPCAWLAAAIWAVHPVQVESVAWVTERKNVLSTLFYVLCLLNWNAFLDNPSRARRHYAFALICSALALLAKTTACTIPAALLIMLWWKRRPIDRKRMLQVAPFVALAGLMGLVTMWWEKAHQGTSGAMFSLSPVERLLIASRGVWFYLGKLMWPKTLVFSYPKWDIQPTAPLQYLPILGLAAAGVVLWRRRDSLRGIIGAGLFFVLALLPMLGVISMWTFRYTYVADHYQYLACLGPIAVVAAAVGKLRSRAWQASAAAIILAALCTMSFLYTRAYDNEESLWKDVLAKNPQSYMAYNNLGAIHYRRGEHAEARRLFERSVAVSPRNAEAHLNIGVLLNKEGKTMEAIEHFRMAVEYLPQYERPHRELCAALTRVGILDEAIEQGEIAVKLEPENAFAHLDLGSALARAGRVDEAEQQFRAAVRSAPWMDKAHLSLGMALALRGGMDEANYEFDQAIQINPRVCTKVAQVLFMNRDFAGAWHRVYQARGLGVPVDEKFVAALSRMMPDPGG